MVKAFYTPDDKRLPETLQSMQRSLSDIQRPTGTERERSLLKLKDAVLELQDVVTELSSRTVHTTSPADLTINTTTPGEFPTATRAFSFPGPAGGGRVATLTLSAEFTRISASGNVTVWVEVLQDGVVTWRRTGAFFIGDTLSAPAGWASTQYMNDTIQIEVANTAASGMQVRLYAHTFVTGSVTAVMRDIRATLTYGPNI